jgi:ribosomal protein L31
MCQRRTHAQFSRKEKQLRGKHPEFVVTHVRCGACGSEFTTRSSRAELGLGVCSSCHPPTPGSSSRQPKAAASIASSGAAHGLACTRPLAPKEGPINNTVHDQYLTAFLEKAEHEGTVDVVAIEELAAELDFGDDELAVVRTELEARGVEIAPASATAPEDDELELDLEPEAAASVASLTQLMNDIGSTRCWPQPKRSRSRRGSSAAITSRRSA